MIEVIGVTKRFQDFTAIQNLSLKVEKSSIYGLVGYNGAGKTTLLKRSPESTEPTRARSNIRRECF